MIADEHLDDKTVYAWIGLGYWKQGDDLACCLGITGDNSEPNVPLVNAFNDHANSMRSVAEHLESIANELSKHDLSQVSVHADTHHIGISGPEPIIQALIEKDLAQIDEMMEEMEEEYNEECDEEFEAERGTD